MKRVGTDTCPFLRISAKVGSLGRKPLAYFNATMYIRVVSRFLHTPSTNVCSDICMPVCGMCNTQIVCHIISDLYIAIMHVPALCLRSNSKAGISVTPEIAYDRTNMANFGVGLKLPVFRPAKKRAVAVAP